MKKFKDYLRENYDVYLDMPHTKKFRATVKMKDGDGKVHEFPIGSDDNIRKAAHETVTGLTKKGFKLEDVDYHFD